MHGESSKPGTGKICSAHETGQWSMLCIAVIVAGSHHVLEAGGNKIVCAHVNFFFFLFMSDAHHGINSSTQKYQSTQSSVVLTTCRQDGGSPPF